MVFAFKEEMINEIGEIKFNFIVEKLFFNIVS